MLTIEYARQRQRRSLDIQQQLRIDALVISAPHHVYYLSTHLPGWQHQAAMVLQADGRTWLTTANQPASAAVDQCIAYEANRFSTLRQDQPALVAEQVHAHLKQIKARRIGVDASAVCSQLALAFDGEMIPIDPDLWQLRRHKDPDELALMQKAFACSQAMYQRARQIIEPGISELRVFGELHAAAIETAGEPLSALLGNDYACGVPGGPARGGRTAQAGELYILDLGPVYRGYFSDSSRAFSVDRKPTDRQLAAWDLVTAALQIVERMARPGVRCGDLFAAVDDHYRAKAGKPLSHHLGHGVGLQPHEYPHLNPKWDDVLQEGDVFTAEPGIYGPELGGGMRLENCYRLTATGVTNLLDFPLGLV